MGHRPSRRLWLSTSSLHLRIIIFFRFTIRMRNSSSRRIRSRNGHSLRWWWWFLSLLMHDKLCHKLCDNHFNSRALIGHPLNAYYEEWMKRNVQFCINPQFTFTSGVLYRSGLPVTTDTESIYRADFSPKTSIRIVSSLSSLFMNIPRLIFHPEWEQHHDHSPGSVSACSGYYGADVERVSGESLRCQSETLNPIKSFRRVTKSDLWLSLGRRAMPRNHRTQHYDARA